MSDAVLDDQGRLTLPKDVRERYGDRYQIVELQNGIKLVPVADVPIDALRDEFSDVEKSPEELRNEARETSLEESGR